MLSRYSCVASESSICSMPVSLREHEGFAVANHDLERLDVLGGGQREHGAGAQVEAGAVARADDAEAVPLALAQRAVVMAAAILDRVELSVDAVDADEERTRLDDLDAPFGDRLDRPYCDLHSISRSSSPGVCPRATLSTFTESSAHLSRIGVSGIPSSSSTSSRPSAATSATVLPLTTSEIIDAAAWLIAQPRPLKRTSRTTSSSISSSTASSSPQSGFTPSAVALGDSRCPLFRGLR